LTDHLDSFRIVRQTFTDDLEPIFELEGGRYLIPLLISAAHEEIEAMRTGKRNRGAVSFASALPKAFDGISRSLFSAVRHGLAHGYGTQLIQTDQGKVGVWFEWTRTPSPHKIDASHLEGMDCEFRVVLNVRLLMSELNRAFDAIEGEIRDDPQLWAKYWENAGRGRQTRASATENARWSELLKTDGKSRYYQ